jgi:hypothetical protein
MSTKDSILLLSAVITPALIGYLLVEINNLKKRINSIPVNNNTEGNKLKLQAIERLSLYTERCGLNNLVARTEIVGLSAAELHHVLIETIKGEYEYNLSQQIYINAEVWNAVTKMKDQNIYVINHIAANLPPGASAIDLSKLIIEYSMTPNADLYKLVLEALQYEAQKILR